MTKPGIPLAAYRDRVAFKLYSLDLGLLSAMSDLDPKTILSGNRLFEEFKGALKEQFVLQQLIAQQINPFYWSAKNSRGEVDFILQMAGNVLPLEVMSSESLQSKSLKSYKERFLPVMSFRTSLSGYREEEWLTNIPLYAVHSISKVIERIVHSRS